MPAILLRLADHARRAAVLVVARLIPGRAFPEVLAQVQRMPARAQAGITLAVLGVLLAAALVAVQVGPLGLAVYVAAVSLLAR